MNRENYIITRVKSHPPTLTNWDIWGMLPSQSTHTPPFTRSAALQIQIRFTHFSLTHLHADSAFLRAFAPLRLCVNAFLFLPFGGVP